jgi:hypothetical protein
MWQLRQTTRVLRWRAAIHLAKSDEHTAALERRQIERQALNSCLRDPRLSRGARRALFDISKP